MALNQLARRRPDDVRGLIGRGEELRRVQDEVLGGGGRDRLGVAARARRSAVDDLIDAALRFMAEEGRGGAEAHRDEVRATLEAASLEAAAGAALLQGRLAGDARTLASQRRREAAIRAQQAAAARAAEAAAEQVARLMRELEAARR